MTTRGQIVAAGSLAAAIAPWTLVVAVNTSLATPAESFHPERCTRACHDRGAPHQPVLPEALAGEDGAVDRVVEGLHRLGELTNLGYGGVNLALFAALWPLSMLLLFAVALSQRLEIRQLRTEQDDG